MENPDQDVIPKLAVPERTEQQLEADRPPSAHVFNTRSVSIYYGSFRAVTDVSLDIYENEITAFIGPSGCGKTTVLRTLNRMNDLVVGARVEGDVRYRGASLYAAGVSPIAVRRRIGMVIYIELMSKVFPSGPLLMACYMGAAANVVLMLILLVGKFVWFRPGAHEVASWIVTGVELLVAIMNMILAYQLANGNPLSSVIAAWYYLAPISPVFSMVGAIVLIMTSSELRKKHHALEIEEHKERAEREFDLAMHEAEMDVRHQYLGYVKNNLVDELNAPERQVEMKHHASVLVAQVLSGISGLSSLPRLSSGTSSALPAAVTGQLSDIDEGWLAQINARVEEERRRRLAEEDGQPVVSVQEEEDAQAARLARLAAAAQSQGYSLERLEQLLGIETGTRKNA